MDKLKASTTRADGRALPARAFRMTTLQSVRKELCSVYRECRAGEMDWQAGSRAAHILSIVANLIKEGDLEARIAKLEEAAGVEE